MEQEYVIAWRSLITGVEEQGTIGFTFDTAKDWCDELNLKYANIIHHWPKPVVTADLDTQPITPLVVHGELTYSAPDDLVVKFGIPDDAVGEDTIELHICPNCVAKMEDVNGVWICPRCRVSAYEGR